MNEEVGFVWKVLIALCAGIFGVAVALAIQHIKIINMPKWLIALAVMVQLLLSWGLFLFICIFFKSGLLPETIPNDEYSALSVAYFCASIPHIIITTAIVIYNKEVNKWLESRYGTGEGLPSMRSDLSNHLHNPSSPAPSCHSERSEESTQKSADSRIDVSPLAQHDNREQAQRVTSAEAEQAQAESAPQSEAQGGEATTIEKHEPNAQDSHTCQTCGAKI